MAHDDPFAGKTVDAALAYYLDTSGTYTPELTATTTDPDLGADGTATGFWHRNGHWITGTAQFLFSGTGLGEGSGLYQISLPFDADVSVMAADGTSGSASVLGSGFIRDNGTSVNSELVLVDLASASVVRLKRHNTTSPVQSTSPFTWAEGDRIAINFAYLADPAGLPT